MSATPELLSADDVATLLGCTREHVQKLCRTKRLAAVNLKGQAGWRITRHALDAFIAGKARTTPAASGRRAAR